MSLRTFLAGTWEPVDSSNVAEAAYDADASRLLVRFDSGHGHWYAVSPSQARDFYEAPSKGTWLWDNVRVRGSKTEHRVPHGPL